MSIIVDNYNYGRYLAAAIDSALAQTHTPTEVIVVDDGSTDGSAGIIRAYGERVRAVFKANGGQASALNAGFAASRGGIVLFLDADDVLQPEAAERMAQAFLAPGTVRAHCRMDLIDADGRRTGGQKPAPHLPLLSGDLRREVLAFPDDLPWLPTSGNAFAAETLRRIMPIPEAAYRILADYYLSHVTPLFGRVAAVEAMSASYRVHGANSYARDGAPLDLAQVRRTIEYWAETHRHIVKFAEALGLPGRPRTPEDLLSVAFVANRMVSRRLEAARHPIAGDSPARLLRLGWRAAARRFNASLPFKMLFLAWLSAMAIAPRAVAYSLAVMFLEPEARRGLNRWLGRQRHTGARPPERHVDSADA
ncbi:MAG: glycosyltransferase family 2 protein [Anaerolineales bacterium]